MQSEYIKLEKDVDEYVVKGHGFLLQAILRKKIKSLCLAQNLLDSIAKKADREILLNIIDQICNISELTIASLRLLTEEIKSTRPKINR